MNREKFLLDVIKNLENENELLENQLDITIRTLEKIANLAGKLAESNAKTSEKEVESCEKPIGKHFKCPICRQISFIGSAWLNHCHICRKCGVVMQPIMVKTEDKEQKDPFKRTFLSRPVSDQYGEKNLFRCSCCGSELWLDSKRCDGVCCPSCNGGLLKPVGKRE